MSVRRHGFVIYWSDGDGCFVAEVPELPGCLAHGVSAQEALAEAQEAVALWIETAEADGVAVPEPKGRRLEFA